MRGENVLPRCCKAGDVRHLATGHEGEGCVRGDSQELADPCARDVFHDERGRSEGEEAEVLIPGGDEPVGRERRRECAADDKPEVPTALTGDDPRLGVARERLDDVLGPLRRLGQWAAERGAELRDGGTRVDRPCPEALEVFGGEVRSAPKEGPFVHAASLRRRARAAPPAQRASHRWR